jgi:hypothetical protein
MMVATAMSIEACGEWSAHDPRGKIKKGDQASPLGSSVKLVAARGAYASFRLLVRGKGSYSLAASSSSGGLELDIFRAWYHRIKGRGGASSYYPDALVLLKKKQQLSLPDKDNRVPGQSLQEFWVDVFVPRNIRPGTYCGQIKMRTKATSDEIAFSVEVLKPRLPEDPCVQIDNNSYGCQSLAKNYNAAITAAGKTGREWQKAIELLHHYYRLSREHRTTFHNLGCGHSGSVDPIYAPRVTGSGRGKRLTDWKLFDAHYGPLLDGRVYKKAAPGAPRARMAPRPIWGIYTPINPDWPSDYLLWGEKGYRQEFVNCLKQFDQHFKEKGWTKSRIEFFFNHKKRYRWYEWDGDEQKYAKDNAYHQKMLDLWEEATLGSKVNWNYRADASWQMISQFDELSGHRNFWVCASFVRWYRKEVEAVIKRGEHLWWYGGYPSIQMSSSAVLQNLWQTWGRGLQGFCHWSAASPGVDPWFDCNGASTGAYYPGERFGIEGPIPSIRTKILRNGIQDIDLLDSVAKRQGRLKTLRAALARKVSIPLWDAPPKAARELPPEDWDSRNLKTEHEPVMEALSNLKPDWWSDIREKAFRLAREEK